MVDFDKHYLYLRVVVFHGYIQCLGHNECLMLDSLISYDGINGIDGCRQELLFIPACCDTLWLHTVSGT